MEETVSRDPFYAYYTSGESAPAAKHFAQLSGTDIYYECNTVAEVWDGDGVTDLYYPALTRFYFTVSQSSGLLASTAQKCDVNQYTKYVDNYLDEIETSSRNDEMYLPFLATHDNDRTAGYLPSMNYLGQMTANLLLLGPGSPFIYYGEELGVRGSRGAAATDANHRLAMVRGDGDTVENPTGERTAPTIGQTLPFWNRSSPEPVSIPTT